jgi:hypothetical protein
VDVPSSPADLYALPLEGFTAARDALAKQLRDGGDAGAAAAVKKLRKPTLVAWAVNAAAREHPGDVEALLEAGRNLRSAQRRTLTVAGTDELRRASEARRAVLQRLTDAAVAVIGDRGAAHRDAIEGTLTAASIDDELGRRLSEGTLDREARPEAGFGAVEGFEVLTGGATSAAEAEAEETPTPAARREAERERARTVREAERRAEAVERAAQRAAEHAARLKEKAAEAAAAAKEAESEARRLADEARTERKRADRARRAAG